MFHFYIPWKHQKTEGFLMFSEGIEVEHWWKIGLTTTYLLLLFRVPFVEFLAQSENTSFNAILTHYSTVLLFYNPWKH